MNKEWSELNKLLQSQIKKRDTYEVGVGTVFTLRDAFWDTIRSFKEDLNREEFNAIPFINADGYHSKTITYPQNEKNGWNHFLLSVRRRVRYGL